MEGQRIVMGGQIPPLPPPLATPLLANICVCAYVRRSIHLLHIGSAETQSHKTTDGGLVRINAQVSILHSYTCTIIIMAM